MRIRWWFVVDCWLIICVVLIGTGGLVGLLGIDRETVRHAAHDFGYWLGSVLLPLP